MKLLEFIEKNIEYNSIIRLLTNVTGGHCTIESDWNKVYMNHEIKDTEYKDWEVLGITSIMVNGRHSDAINIVLHDPNPYRNFINNLRSDKDMRRAYKDNIAMAFKDTFDESKSLHENANTASEYFLELLLREVIK